MDLRLLIHDVPVDPTPPSRRFSNSQTPLSVTDSPSHNNESFSGMKRPMSSSTAGEEPPLKRLARKRPIEKPIWAQRWTPAWHQKFGGKNGNGFFVKPTPASASPSAPANGAIAAPPAQQQQQQQQQPLQHRVPSQRPPSSPQPAAAADAADARPERSYLNIFPKDELVKTVADFIYFKVVNGGWLEASGPTAEVEIEAKLGTIIDKNTNDRLRLPVMHEAVLNDAGLNIAFRSSMTQPQHRAMNEHLNKAVQESLPRKDSGATPSGTRRQPMSYRHYYELDKFFQLDNTTSRELPPKLQSMVAQKRQKPRIRVTWDTKTNQVINKIIKIRLCDLHVYNPRTMFDWRLSVSLEVKYDGELNSLIPAEDSGRVRNGRKKDRMSYTHQGVRIDLTQVTMTKDAEESSKGVAEKELEHELELELPVDALKNEVAKLPADSEGYSSLIRLFVDDVRMATRQFPNN